MVEGGDVPRVAVGVDVTIGVDRLRDGRMAKLALDEPDICPAFEQEVLRRLYRVAW